VKKVRVRMSVSNGEEALVCGVIGYKKPEKNYRFVTDLNF